MRGSASGARREARLGIGALSAEIGPSGVVRYDPVQLPPATERLREEVRDFIADHRNLMQKLPMGYSPEFSRKMAQKGWVAMTWPKKWGGHERSALERYVVLEEMLAAGAPVGAHWVADRQSGPNIMRVWLCLA